MIPSRGSHARTRRRYRVVSLGIGRRLCQVVRVGAENHHPTSLIFRHIGVDERVENGNITTEPAGTQIQAILDGKAVEDLNAVLVVP
jgi:hypothetical protein